MSDVVSIRQRRPGGAVTPEIVAMERVHAGNACEQVLALNQNALEAIRSSLDSLLDAAMARRSLADNTMDQIEALGGLDHESVFDLAFTVHFEISAAIEATRLLRTVVIPKRG
ncbi:hypothetical protein NJC40_03360 [Pseudomonas sp. 21LCFQ02]|uniref:hypothetical protein n=1 Tax=Pseudomonas sp. 21LCFQ02 TaxID=2957505 RepID=UPI00209B9001|nr:hypothetical protein [Pseudomonas sp. 21LCFQ02]MCO8166815.1 hypothetical protein [Pseudomonas sp. 21LCFQ02]